MKTIYDNKVKEQNAILNLATAENRDMTTEELEKVKNLEVEITNLDETIKAKVKADAREVESKKVVNNSVLPDVKDNKQPRLFKNFVEQLIAVKNVATTGKMDERLAQINNATGANEGNGADGGFAVQSDFAGLMMETAAKSGNILPLLDTYEISGKANRIDWVDIDETSVATTVFGGVMVYWAAEAATVTESKPKLIAKKMELEKLMGIAYATYELDADSSFISDLYTRAFTLAIQRELENCVISGTGAGKPLGFLKGGSLVEVTKETGQTADTVVYENIVKMYNRALDKNKSVWLMHPDVQAELDFMQFPVGVGGVPVYLGASSVGTLASLKGRPIVENDACSALGDLGDINFVDLSEYMLIKKGGVVADTSMHVQFLAAENCFRFIFRANGMPKKNSALTIKNSALTRSSFVTLKARA